MKIVNNGILLSDILKNFAELERIVDELKFDFKPSKLYLKTPTELNNFNNTLRNINIALRDVKKFLGVDY